MALMRWVIALNVDIWNYIDLNVSFRLLVNYTWRLKCDLLSVSDIVRDWWGIVQIYIESIIFDVHIGWRTLLRKQKSSIMNDLVCLAKAWGKDHVLSLLN